MGMHSKIGNFTWFMSPDTATQNAIAEYVRVRLLKSLLC